MYTLGAYTVSKTKVVQLDMFYGLIEAEKIIIELVFFNGFELYVKLELIRLQMLVLLICIHKN